MSAYRGILFSVSALFFISILITASYGIRKKIETELATLQTENDELMSELGEIENSLIWLQGEHRRNPYKGLRKVIATAYNSFESQTDSDPFITASGNRVGVGTLALSRDQIMAENEFMVRMGYNPLGSLAYGDTVDLIYVRRMVVHDTMNKRFRNRADIWMDNYRNARLWGKREVYIAPAGAIN